MLSFRGERVFDHATEKLRRLGLSRRCERIVVSRGLGFSARFE